MTDSELVRAVKARADLAVSWTNETVVVWLDEIIPIIEAHESKQSAAEVDDNQRWAFLSRLRPPPSQPTEQVQPDTKLNVSHPINAEVVELLNDMRMNASYSYKVTMPVPLYERIKETLATMQQPKP